MTNLSKNEKNIFFMSFDPFAAVFVIMMGKWLYTFMTNFLEDSSFSFISLTMVAMEKGKNAISQLP